ncbi:MFS transporter [Cohnella pontilimi]|uniref:MFS transporter n=1 Tax=Cohnella pontilimi TaxID=2564100 RepID=UPI00145F7061|nr:MFS transporter [Cohnella pontilimi]
MRKLAAYYFLFYLSISVLQPYMSIFFSDKGFSYTEVGFILSLGAFVSVIAQPTMGMINDRMRNPRIVLMSTVLLAPLIGLGFSFSSLLAVVIALNVIFTWFQSSSAPLADAIAVEIGSREGFSFGSVRLWGALSYALGTFFTGFIYGKYGYDHIFIFFLAVSTLVFVLLFWFPNTKPAHQDTTFFEQAKEVVRNKPFLFFLGISMITAISSATNFSFLPIYFKEMGFDKSLLGTAYAVAALIEVPMFWVATILCRKIGSFNVLSLSAAIYALKCFLLYALHDVYLTLGVQLLDGISFAFAAGTAVEVVGRFASVRTKATFQTIYAAVTWGLGGIFGNAAGGVIADGMGTPFLYVVLFGLSATASVLFVYMDRIQSRNKHAIIFPTKHDSLPGNGP